MDRKASWGTDLVHLTVGSIANHLHQLKNTCRILEEMLHGQEKETALQVNITV